MKKFILMFGLLGGGLALSAQNLIPEGDFEQLRADGLPNGPDWAWRSSGSKSLKVDQTASDRPADGKALHLTDLDHGNSNDGLTWMMAGNELPRWRGKTMRLSCRIKQIKASAPLTVGIGYWIKRKNGKTERGFVGPETSGETVWTDYKVDFKVPDDADVFFVFLHCANGWGNEAEASFDHLKLEPLPASAP